MKSDAARPTLVSTLTALAVVLVVTTLPKLLLILGSPEDLYRVGKNALPHTWIGEEAHRGTTTLDFLRGMILPLLDYQYAPFFGGALVVSFVAYPFFVWLGPSVSALKMSGLVFNGVATLFLFLALDRAAGRRAAWFGTLLFAIAAPGYSTLAITAFGSHVETNAFTMAAWYFAIVATSAPREGDGPRRDRSGAVFGLGFTAGFGIYFSYIVCLSLGAIGLALVIGGRLGDVLKRWKALTLGFLLGFSPWLAFNLPRDFAGLSIYGGGLTGPTGVEPAPPLERVGDLLTHGYPGSFFFEALGPIDGRVQGLVSAIVLGLLFVASSGLLRTREEPGGWSLTGFRTHGALPALIQPLLFLGAYGFTKFDVGDEPYAVVSFRYVYTIFPFVAAAAGISLAALWQHAGARRTAAAVLALLVIAPAGIGTARRVDFDRWGADLEVDGYSDSALGRFLVLTFADQPEVVTSAVERAYELRTDEELHEMLFGMSMQLRQVLLSKNALRPRMERVRQHADELLATLRQLARPEHQPYFEPVGPGTRMFRADQRELFWEHHRRQRKAPEEE